MSRGWIGVDLDGTLAHYDGFKGPEHIGEPVPAMLERVKQWIEEGREVRIFTARVGASLKQNGDGTFDDHHFANQARYHIEQWCIRHVGVKLEVTATKDFGMIELWDDRCVQVQPNAGVPVHEFWKHSL